MHRKLIIELDKYHHPIWPQKGVGKEKLANAASSHIFVNLEYLSSALVLNSCSHLVLMFFIVGIFS